MRHLPLLFFFFMLPLFLLVIWSDDVATSSSTSGWPVGQPVPAVSLTLFNGTETAQNTDPAMPLHALKGQYYLLNLFASWCAPCAAEQATLQQIADTHQLPILGIAWKTKPDKLKLFLAEHGNPFRQIFMDSESKAMLSLGAVGVPETYLVDAQGIIRYHVTGSLSLKEFEKNILPLIGKK